MPATTAQLSIKVAFGRIGVVLIAHARQGSGGVSFGFASFSVCVDVDAGSSHSGDSSKKESAMAVFPRLLGALSWRGVLAFLILIAGAIGIWFAVELMREGMPPDDSQRVFIDTENGKWFRHKIRIGESAPVFSPYSGKTTGMPAEACYWKTDGSSKAEPTYVLLNELVGKTGPTFCPDCGRLVVGHNPSPGPDITPPPTAAEYAARRASQPTSADPRLNER